jgi:hypothetical protein
MRRALREQRSVLNDIERFLVLWCHTMHDNITWPRGGQYECRTCGRRYPVPWAQPERIYAPAPSIPVNAVLDHAPST